MGDIYRFQYISSNEYMVTKSELVMRLKKYQGVGIEVSSIIQ